MCTLISQLVTDRHLPWPRAEKGGRQVTGRLLGREYGCVCLPPKSRTLGECVSL